MPPGSVKLTPLAGIPFVQEGDDVACLVGDAIEGAGISPADFDVVVVTQKIVSKAEGRQVRLAGVEPSPRAIELAASLDKDPRMVEVVLGESNDIVAHGHGRTDYRASQRTRHGKRRCRSFERRSSERRRGGDPAAARSGRERGGTPSRTRRSVRVSYRGGDQRTARVARGGTGSRGSRSARPGCRRSPICAARRTSSVCR